MSFGSDQVRTHVHIWYERSMLYWCNKLWILALLTELPALFNIKSFLCVHYAVFIFTSCKGFGATPCCFKFFPIYILSTLWHVVLQNAMSRLESNQRVVLRENIDSIVKFQYQLKSSNIQIGMEKSWHMVILLP